MGIRFMALFFHLLAGLIYTELVSAELNELPIDYSTRVPPIRHNEVILMDMCMKHGGKDLYDKARTAVSNLNRCFYDFLVYARLPSEIKEKRPTGELDTVFKSYCEHIKEKQTCIVDFLLDVETCLPDKHRVSKSTVETIVDELLQFTCENEGDHIALFISEKGPECIESKALQVQQCIKVGLNQARSNETSMSEMGNTIDTPIWTDEAEEQFSVDFNFENCKMAHGIRKCILKELATCSGSTPANVVESMFMLVQNATTCRRYKRSDLDPDYVEDDTDSTRTIFTIFVLLIGIGFVIFCVVVAYICR